MLKALNATIRNATQVHAVLVLFCHVTVLVSLLQSSLFEASSMWQSPVKPVFTIPEIILIPKLTLLPYSLLYSLIFFQLSSFAFLVLVLYVNILMLKRILPISIEGATLAIRKKSIAGAGSAAFELRNNCSQVNNINPDVQ